MSSNSVSSSPSQIPITVFTGFLGAGKTSIILSLLPQLPSDYRVVLLKNEFGDIEGSSMPRIVISEAIHVTNNILFFNFSR